MRKNLLKVIATLMLSTFVISACSMVCFAVPGSLNEIGGSQAVGQVQEVQEIQETEPTNVIGPATSSQQVPSDVNLFDDSKVSESNKSSADAVGEIFKQGGLTEESVEKSKKWVEPIAKIINLLVAIVTSLLALGIVCISVLDLVYIQLPFTRSFLAPTQSNLTSLVQGTQGQMGNMTQGQGQIGNQMQPPTHGSNSSKQWVSDEAIASLRETQPQQAQQGIVQQDKPGGKNVLLSYAKKRSFSLIMLGVCVVLFTCTVFTDIGVIIGMKLLALASGISL